MKAQDLVNQVKNISGYNSSSLTSVDSEVELVNDNMIFKGINEGKSFINMEIMPDELDVPLNIDFKTDVIGTDLINLKLSSYNDGSVPDSSSKVKWKEMLNIPWKLLASGISSLKCNQIYKTYWFSQLSRNLIFSTEDYLRMCSMGFVGTMSVNKIKSATFKYDNLSTLKTIFELEDNDGNKLGQYSVTTNTNVYKFSFNFVDVSINYQTGLITAFYRGSSPKEYKIIIKTLSHPYGVFYFNNGNLRTSKVNNFYNQGSLTIRLRTYALYDGTQKIPFVYTTELSNLLAYKGALEVQRFNRSMDQNLANIVDNKINMYSNRERFSSLGRTNDLNYF